MEKKNSGLGHWVATRSSETGRFITTKSISSGRVHASGSFGLPNGDRIATVRRDIMDRALGRNAESKR